MLTWGFGLNAVARAAFVGLIVLDGGLICVLFVVRFRFGWRLFFVGLVCGC